MTDFTVKEALIHQLSTSRGVLRDEIVEELGRTGGIIDSLEGLELAIEAERTFGVTISDKELSSGICRSIPYLVACVRSKLTESPQLQGRLNDDFSKHV